MTINVMSAHNAFYHVSHFLFFCAINNQECSYMVRLGFGQMAKVFCVNLQNIKYYVHKSAE